MIVDTNYGQIRGVREEGITVFRGVPYAAPPEGALRFKPPEPPKPWKGVLSALEFGPIAPQGVALDGTPRPKSENCLTLNIWMPGNEQPASPVLVYIHGGAFLGGSGADFDGSRYAREDGIVCVTINYRLGAFGFLYLGDCLGDEYRTSGNNGILDIIAALQWVREHIASFGGDPKRVTIMGNSAGGKCVSTLLVTPAASGLFHGAIAQSGATQSIRDTKTSSRVAHRLLEKIGIREDEADKLLEVSADTILKHQETFLHTFGPVQDGIVIPQAPLDAIREGMCNQVPLLVGSNKDEAATYIYSSPEMEEPDNGYLVPMFGANSELVWDRYRKLSAYMPPSAAWRTTLTDCMYRMATIRLAEQWAQRGYPVWLYRFDFAGRIGAGHGMENAFVADSQAQEEDLPPAEWIHIVPPEGKALARSMHAAWVAFVHRGNPNVCSLPHWRQFDVHNRNMMCLDGESRLVEEPPLLTYDFPNQVFKL